MIAGHLGEWRKVSRIALAGEAGVSASLDNWICVEFAGFWRKSDERIIACVGILCLLGGRSKSVLLSHYSMRRERVCVDGPFRGRSQYAYCCLFRIDHPPPELSVIKRAGQTGAESPLTSFLGSRDKEQLRSKISLSHSSYTIWTAVSSQARLPKS